MKKRELKKKETKGIDEAIWSWGCRCVMSSWAVQGSLGFCERYILEYICKYISIYLVSKPWLGLTARMGVPRPERSKVVTRPAILRKKKRISQRCQGRTGTGVVPCSEMFLAEVCILFVVERSQSTGSLAKSSEGTSKLIHSSLLTSLYPLIISTRNQIINFIKSHHFLDKLRKKKSENQRKYESIL